MAHEIENRDGTDSFFQVIRRPVALAWHKLGTYFQPEQRPQTTAEAWKLCRGDFEVEVRDNSFTCYTPEGDSYQKVSTLSGSIVRTDLQTEVGTASPKYPVMMFPEATRVLDAFIGEGLLEIETAAVMRGGASGFLLVRWNLEKFGELCREAFGDKIRAYGLASVSHTGTRGTEFYDTDVTVVCANTERMAMSSAQTFFKVRHSNVAGTRIVDGVGKLWGGIVAQREAVARDIMTLRGITLDETTFRRAVLDVIAPMPTDAKPFVVKRVEDTRILLRELWTGGLGHVGNGSAWEAYQAVTEAADHSGSLWRPRSLERQAEGLLAGPMVAAKHAAFASLLSLAK